MSLTDTAVSAIVGLLAGIVGTLIAPWVHWGIEKRREKLKSRQAIIKVCREKLDWGFDRQTFRRTQEYLYIRPHLTPQEIEKIENDRHIIVDSTTDPYKQVIVDGIRRLEKLWDLV